MEDRMTAKTEPGGAWTSPITFESLVEGAINPSDLKVADGRLYWLESRPAEGGRLVAMTGDGAGARALTGDPFNVRTRVHEYGGGAYTVIGDRLVFSNFKDQRLYALADGGAAEALTGPGYRYADAAPLPAGGLVCVREDHTDPAEVRNAVVRLSGAPGDSGEVLYGASDFVAYPRVSPDGRRLAWIAWDHPNMPWDTTRLHVADLGPEGLSNVELVAGGEAESVLDPKWSADGALHFISDRTGFWNLYRRAGNETRALLPKSAEFARPLWILGQSNYAFMDDGRVVARYGEGGRDHLVVVDPGTGAAREIGAPFVECGGPWRLDARRVALIAASADQPPAIVAVDIERGEIEVMRRPSSAAVGGGYISRAEAISFPSADGRTAHALYYPPANVDFRLPDGQAPPLVVQAHGGPTASASPAFSLASQFWTSRGFALVDVDYGGSTGYGRAYRETLKGQWGVVDVEDVIAAARHLIETGRADPRRIAIHGGSAGGFTVLAALARSDVFSAGGDFYGVSDLEALARDTHKFESRYLDSLIGPYPAARALYEERSPIHHLEGFRTPLIILQGAEDPVVPPNQARMILEALRARKTPVAYLEFAGEAHGFRRAETIIAAKQAELYFYGRVFGFTPADRLPETPIENLEAPAPAG
jgi:dipeptidyl aminopeptidase/acylaminoacyl peptidase